MSVTIVSNSVFYSAIVPFNMKQAAFRNACDLFKKNYKNHMSIFSGLKHWLPRIVTFALWNIYDFFVEKFRFYLRFYHCSKIIQLYSIAILSFFTFTTPIYKQMAIYEFSRTFRIYYGTFI